MLAFALLGLLGIGLLVDLVADDEDQEAGLLIRIRNKTDW